MGVSSGIISGGSRVPWVAAVHGNAFAIQRVGRVVQRIIFDVVLLLRRTVRTNNNIKIDLEDFTLEQA